MRIAEVTQAYDKIMDLLSDIESVYNSVDSEELNEAFNSVYEDLSKLRRVCNSTELPVVKQRGRPPKKKVKEEIEEDIHDE
jgi:hypothetical protein